MAQPTSRAALFSFLAAVIAMVNNLTDKMRTPIADATPFEQGEAVGHLVVVILITLVGVILAIVALRAIREGKASGTLYAIGALILNAFLLITGVFAIIVIEKHTK